MLCVENQGCSDPAKFGVFYGDCFLIGFIIPDRVGLLFLLRLNYGVVYIIFWCGCAFELYE